MYAHLRDPPPPTHHSSASRGYNSGGGGGRSNSNNLRTSEEEGVAGTSSNPYNPLYTPQPVKAGGGMVGRSASTLSEKGRQAAQSPGAGKGWSFLQNDETGVGTEASGMVNTPRNSGGGGGGVKTNAAGIYRSASGGGPGLGPVSQPITGAKLVSTACQTDYNGGVAKIISGVPEPRGPKVFFRVVFDEKVLQFKLSCDCCFKVMFAAVEVRADFVWHGVVLDEQLTPADYNMLPGEEQTATIQVVRSTDRKTTHAEDIRMNDVARSLGFRLRLQEDRNTRLELEVDRMEAALASLHQEVQTVTERSAEKIQEADIRCQEMDRKRKEAMDEALHYQREVESLKRQLQLHAQLVAQAEKAQKNQQQQRNSSRAGGNPSALFGGGTNDTNSNSAAATSDSIKVSPVIEGPSASDVIDSLHPASNPHTSRNAGSGPGGLNHKRKQQGGDPAVEQRRERRAAEMELLRNDVNSWQQQQKNLNAPGYMGSTSSSRAAGRTVPGSVDPITVRGGGASNNQRTTTPGGSRATSPVSHGRSSAGGTHATSNTYESPVRGVEGRPSMGVSESGATEASPDFGFNTNSRAQQPRREKSIPFQRSESRKGGYDYVEEGEEGFGGGVGDDPFSNAAAGGSPPQAAPAPPVLDHSVAITVILMDEAEQKETTLPPVVIPSGVELTVGSALREVLASSPDVLPPANECMLCLQGPSGYRVLEAAEAAKTPISEEDTLFIAKMASALI